MPDFTTLRKVSSSASSHPTNIGSFGMLDPNRSESNKRVQRTIELSVGEPLAIPREKGDLSNFLADEFFAKEKVAVASAKVFKISLRVIKSVSKIINALFDS